MKKTITLSLLLVLNLTAKSGYSQKPITSANYSYQTPRQERDGLLTDNLLNVGMDTTRIVALTKLILAHGLSNVHSLIIVKDNKLVYENYFAGSDQRHGKKLGHIEHTVNQVHDCRSISKSIVSACIGIAIQKGIISGVDDPIKKYFPEIKDSVKSTIKIKHLLTMTSGLTWNEIGHYANFFNSETQMNIRFNPIKYVLKQPMVATPGTQWNYNGGNTQLLAEIIYRTSGLTVDKFAEKYLFKPLGIQEYEWVQLAVKNIPAAASGLRLSSRSMAKFGLLYMNKGKLNNVHLLDSAWIEQSLQCYIQRPQLHNFKINDGGYGYQFWTYKETMNSQPIDIYEAKGNGGQSIFLCRSSNLIVITTAGNYNQANNAPYKMLTEYILPSIK